MGKSRSQPHKKRVGNSEFEVDVFNGLNGNRVCKVDLSCGSRVRDLRSSIREKLLRPTHRIRKKTWRPLGGTIRLIKNGRILHDTMMLKDCMASLAGSVDYFLEPGEILTQQSNTRMSEQLFKWIGSLTDYENLSRLGNQRFEACQPDLVAAGLDFSFVQLQNEVTLRMPRVSGESGFLAFKGGRAILSKVKLSMDTKAAATEQVPDCRLQRCWDALFECVFTGGAPPADTSIISLYAESNGYQSDATYAYFMALARSPGGLIAVTCDGGAVGYGSLSVHMRGGFSQARLHSIAGVALGWHPLGIRRMLLSEQSAFPFCNMTICLMNLLDNELFEKPLQEGEWEDKWRTDNLMAFRCAGSDPEDDD